MAYLIKKMVLGATLAATALTAAAPAEAQRYRRYNRGGGDVAAGAVLGGIVGLGIGAAIASNNRDRFYDRRFRGRGWRNDRFIDPRFGGGFGFDPRFGGGFDPRFGGGFDPRFGGGFDPRLGGGFDPRFGGFGGRCYTVRQFDPWSGRRIRTRVCD